jgi:hypothetical protein
MAGTVLEMPELRTGELARLRAVIEAKDGENVTLVRGHHGAC